MRNIIKPNTSRDNVNKKEGVDIPWKKANSFNGELKPTEKGGRLVTTNAAKGKTA